MLFSTYWTNATSSEVTPLAEVNPTSCQYLLVAENILSVELLVCLHVGFEGFLVLEGLGTDGTLQQPVLAVGADVGLVKVAVGKLHVAELAQQ